MRIIIVVPPNRFDFYSYLKELENHELILLWHVKPKDFDLSLEALPIKFSNVIYWGDFRSPGSLLKKIKPERIIFFEIIDLRQIALIVRAKKFSIRTLYLEHGAAGDRDAAIAKWLDPVFEKGKLKYFFNRIFNSFGDIVKSKWFYYSVQSGFKTYNSYLKYFRLPFLMIKRIPNRVLSEVKFSERIPDKAIVFNEVNFEQFEAYTGISKEDSVFTGVPLFDKYFKEQISESEHYVYIDHPYLEHGFFEWNLEHHELIAKTLFQFAETQKIKLFIKLHPLSEKKNWDKFNYNDKYISIIQDGDFTELFLKSKLILGFSSSMLTGFLCAKKNVVLLGWHPKPQIFGVDFSETGLCHQSLLIAELNTKFKYWNDNNLALLSIDRYDKFLKRFNCPFDGQAANRVITTITENEVI